MDSTKSLDDSYSIIAALLCDVQNSQGLVFNTRSLRLDLKKIKARLKAEGLGFLTKSLPRLGKAFDKVLSEEHLLNSAELGFKPENGCKYPKLFGVLFSRVLRPDGGLLPSPCVNSIRSIRDLCYLFYKYEVPYTDEQEQTVIAKFEETERDLDNVMEALDNIRNDLDVSNGCWRRRRKAETPTRIAREARILLSRLFEFFDPREIQPRHGPGAVATKQQLWEKYQWTNVSERITRLYPLDAYFKASLGHVCDTYDSDTTIAQEDLPARVLLVPKDSRGPRLISCEPVDFQWVQQGLGRAIVRLVEGHWTTKFNVFFTDQQPNQRGALLGSSGFKPYEYPDGRLTGRYSTLDLNEASDRVSVGLVRLLFPAHIYEYLEACRSLSTVLPDGRILKLKKFAPMGSALCFPLLALTVWAILTAGAPDADTREGILVYGDDVIVPTAYAENAIKHLESFGLKVNRDKSCTKGFFRESCGTDAFQGINVTPVRLRTIWESSPSAEVYTSWIAYANAMWDRQYYHTYDLIVSRLVQVYGPIPSEAISMKRYPSLRFVPDSAKPTVRRYNRLLQKWQYRVWDVKSPEINKVTDGWSMLLRYFAEAETVPEPQLSGIHYDNTRLPFEGYPWMSVSQYTRRHASMLVRRWR